MSTYIEPFLLQNLLLTYLIGATSYRFLRLKREWWRLLTASMAGTLSALFYPFLSVPVAVNVLIKVTLGGVLSVILYIGKCNFVKGAAAFYFSAFVYGGCMAGIGCLVYKNTADALTKPLSVNVYLSIIAALVLYHSLREFCVLYHRSGDVQKRVYRYEMQIGGRIIEGSGFMDTGNCLYDGSSGLPVVVLGVKTLMPYLSDEELTELLTGQADKVFKGARRMRCKSVGGKSDLWLVQPDKFEVYLDTDKNILYEVMVGLSFSALSGGESYDAILHPALTEVTE